MCFNFFKKKDTSTAISVDLEDTSTNSVEIPSTENKPKSMWETLKPIDLSKIHFIDFPENQYHKSVAPKKQIVLHHTVSGDGVNGDISTWEDDPAVVATCMIVDRGGTPWQLFNSKYWAHHLGLKSSNNMILNRDSIGIEIDNWGQLVLGDGTTKQFGTYNDGTPKMVYTVPGKFYTYYGTSVNVVTQHYPNGFMENYYYEKYTNAQIQTVGELLLYWHNSYGISLKYNEDMWDKSQNALNQVNGVWTHVSYRGNGKSDCHPQPELIEMLKTLESIC